MTKSISFDHREGRAFLNNIHDICMLNVTKNDKKSYKLLVSFFSSTIWFAFYFDKQEEAQDVVDAIVGDISCTK